MRRAYVDVSHFRAPYDGYSLTLTGLGGVLPGRWPVGRAYYDVSNFRAPYDQGYFQNNQLFGLGAAPPVPTAPSPPTAPPTGDMLGSTLALIGVGAIAGGALAYLLMRGRKAIG